MKGENGEALESNGIYKEERSAEKGGQISLERQTKEGTVAQGFTAGIRMESGKKEIMGMQEERVGMRIWETC